MEASPHDLLAETRSAMEDVAAKMLSLKRHGPSTTVKPLLVDMSLLFISLRQANRLILVEEERVKAETERARAPVDSTTLQLHNLMYEKSHYLKAIKACNDFRSRYPDIDLVPVPEFLADAPEDVKAAQLSTDPAHDLMLRRLNYELFQRKQLCRLREELELRKKRFVEIIATRKKFLSSLPSHLKSLKKASMPVQQQLGMLHIKKLKQHRAAELLPPPLYMIYTQLLAQKEAFQEKIELEILGSMKDAQTYAIQHHSDKDVNGIAAKIETNRLEDETPDDEDDVQRRRKRPRKATSKDSLEDAGLYQSHPLNVIVHVFDEESDVGLLKLLTLRFEFLVKLNVVCVQTDEIQDGPENSILCNLFPGDTGLQLPHQMAKRYAGDFFTFDEKKVSRPYKWVQHLAGMDFLPELSPLLASIEASNNEMPKGSAILSGLSLYRRQNRVETFLQRIRSRRKAQLALQEQLDFLAKLKWPSLMYGNIPWGSQVPLCNIEQWSLVKRDIEQSMGVSALGMQKPLGSSNLNMEERLGTLKDGVESATEDGELPSAIHLPTIPDENNVSTPSNISIILERSRSFSLIAKSSSSAKGKSPRGVKYDDDIELAWDSETETEKQDMDLANDDDIIICDSSSFSWEKYGIREYNLILNRTEKDKTLKLQAKVVISTEYPVRPPSISLSFCKNTGNTGGEPDVKDDLIWFNELRAMEAEVNLHLIKIVPQEHDKYVLAHQVRCLGMLFDFHFGQLQNCLETMKSSSVIDLGLCKPVTGQMIARSHRGRDRRKMFSWKRMGCAPGYPY